VNNTIKMFDHLRSKMGFEVEFMHDFPERVPPTQAPRRLYRAAVRGSAEIPPRFTAKV
jgi:hypothetical protein